jgi:hypothetical protein
MNHERIYDGRHESYPLPYLAFLVYPHPDTLIAFSLSGGAGSFGFNTMTFE